MTCDDWTKRRRAGLTMRRRAFFLRGLAVAAMLATTGAWAQGVDCAGLRAAIDASASQNNNGHFDLALRQQRDEIARTRAYATDSGCDGNGIFDDPDSSQCRGLLLRINQLEVGLQRLQDEAARGDPTADDRRRALNEQYNAACSADAGTAGQDLPNGTVPVDPDAPPEATEPSATPPAKFTHVLCVRHCDGAYYPLAVDVATDRMGDMDRICQAQCPTAESSAYSTGDSEDVSKAQATDGSAYATLANAFKFRVGSTAGCGCRAPHQSWADALAGAEAMLEPHKGDVTVTPALAAAMVRPIPAPPVSVRPAKANVPKASPSSKKAPSRPAAPLVVPAPGLALPPDGDRDLTREFRRSDPTL